MDKGIKKNEKEEPLKDKRYEFLLEFWKSCIAV